MKDLNPTSVEIERYWTKVDVRGPDEDWLWTAGRFRNGYGAMSIAKVNRPAHRVGYRIATGQDPGALFVCHTCDVPLCQNPRHLFIGTPADNMADMHAKGRHWVPTKLTFDDVEEIRRLLSRGQSQYRIAERFGVHQTAISLINTGRNWKQPT